MKHSLYFNLDPANVCSKVCKLLTQFPQLGGALVLNERQIGVTGLCDEAAAILRSEMCYKLSSVVKIALEVCFGVHFD